MSPTTPQPWRRHTKHVGKQNVSLTIFITSMSGSKSLTSFAYRFFHFRRPSDLRLAFDAAERHERIGCIQCQKSEESKSSGNRKSRVFLCRRTVRVKVKGKVISTSFLKIEGRGNVHWGGRVEKEGQFVELESD